MIGTTLVSKWGKRLMVLHSVWPAITAVPLSRAVRKYNGRIDLYALKDPKREGKPDPCWRQNVDKVIEHARSELGVSYNIKVLFINGVL